MRKIFLLMTIMIVALILAACSSQTATNPPSSAPTQAPTEESTTESVEASGEEMATVPDALIKNPWQWVHFMDPTQEFDVTDSENYILEFKDDGTVNVKADCNNALGSFEADDSSIKIELGPTTLVACPEGSKGTDFLEYLGFAAIYFFEGDDLFIDLMADGGTMQFSPYTDMGSEMPAGSAEFDPNAEPIVATVNIGGADELWLDPMLISMRSGILHGESIDTFDLGEGCTGLVPPRPDVVFYWKDYEEIDTLRVFFLSMGDPTMLLVTPSGEVICNDDFSQLIPDPYIEISDPEEGRYAVFIGSFEDEAVVPGFLVMTGFDQNPSTMDLAQLFPRQIDPGAIGDVIPLDVLDLESDKTLLPPSGNLTTVDVPFQQELTGGGEIGAFDLDQSNHLCTGFISAEPNFRFEQSGDINPLVIFFESDVDTTLMVMAPDGAFHCDDDYHSHENLNPWLSLTPIEGTYYVWVGSYSPDVPAEGTLTVTNDADSIPTPLKPEDLK